MPYGFEFFHLCHWKHKLNYSWPKILAPPTSRAPWNMCRDDNFHFEWLTTLSFRNIISSGKKYQTGIRYNGIWIVQLVRSNLAGGECYGCTKWRAFSIQDWLGLKSDVWIWRWPWGEAADHEHHPVSQNSHENPIDWNKYFCHCGYASDGLKQK